VLSSSYNAVLCTADRSSLPLKRVDGSSLTEFPILVIT